MCIIVFYVPMKKIIAGNWKMHKTREEALALATEMASIELPEQREVILFVPFPFLSEVSRITASGKRLHTGAQNCHHQPQGAYTGEVSVPMIGSCGARYVLVGHSERRQYFHEDGVFLQHKLQAVLQGGLTPVYCMGETLQEREDNLQQQVIARQLQESLFPLGAEALHQVVIAYEPVWAIGTGRTATPEQAQEMHAFIRSMLVEFAGSAAASVPLLYGGSVNPGNAAQLFSMPDIDGGLVGGASLKKEDFAAIIRA
jgi:triosephosphate isomerase